MPTPASDNRFPKVKLVEGAAPATPPAGEAVLYAKSDSTVAIKNDAGVETVIGEGAAAHIADTTDAHDASAISIVDTGAYFTGTDVEAALQEVGAASAAAHIADTTDAHDASAISIVDTGAYFTGTDVEAALQELGAGGGGGGGLTDYGQGFHVGDLLPTSPGSYDEEFEGTADTLPANWTWEGAGGTPTFYLNSRLPSWLYVPRDSSTTTTWIARRASFSPGTGVAWGLWSRIICGGRGGAYNASTELWVLNSDNSEGRGIGILDSMGISGRKYTGGAEAGWENPGSLPGSQPSFYVGITRDASNYWRAFASVDGIGWQCVAGVGTNGSTHAFTPARLELRFKAQYNDTAPMRHGVDFIRYRTDTDFPRP